MTVPFRVDPESVRRQAPQDPFLEFESERPSRSLLGEKKDEPNRDEPEDGAGLRPSLAAPSPDRADTEPRARSAISPSIAFAVGVAGLVTAAVGYYQMGQLLADRSQPPAASATAPQVNSTTGPVAPPAPVTGRLEIVSDPAGATVKVNGRDLGVTPLTLPDFKPGDHQIVLTRGTSTVTRTVALAAGGNALVTAVLAQPAVAAPAAPAAAPRAASPPANAGWVTFDSPLELRVLSRGQPAGSTRGRVSLAAGSHEFELVSDVYEIRQTISARVAAGQGTRIAIQLPSGLLSINALPWADVWVDGTPVGTTPLANLSLKVGTHQVVLRHPTLGERQQAVIVKAVTPARVGVTFNR